MAAMTDSDAGPDVGSRAANHVSCYHGTRQPSGNREADVLPNFLSLLALSPPGASAVPSPSSLCCTNLEHHS